MTSFTDELNRSSTTKGSTPVSNCESMLYLEQLLNTGEDIGINANNEDTIATLFRHLIREKAERKRLYAAIFGTDLFHDLVDHSVGSVLLQNMIVVADEEERAIISKAFIGHLVHFANRRFSSIVLKRALSVLKPPVLDTLLQEFQGYECKLACGCYGNLVLRNMIGALAPDKIGFIVTALLEPIENLRMVVEDMFGFRVLRDLIRRFEDITLKGVSECAEVLLEKIYSAIVGDCRRCMVHKFANYVVKEILYSKAYEIRRNAIIRATLGNIVSLAKDKYASHVLQEAFKMAPPPLLSMMVEEVFARYDDNGLCGFEILLFDLFGNYVVQTLLGVAGEVKMGKRRGDPKWYDTMLHYAMKHHRVIGKYSSGKRIFGKIMEINSLIGNIGNAYCRIEIMA